MKVTLQNKKLCYHYKKGAFQIVAAGGTPPTTRKGKRQF
jgi:hypothetical protein